MPFPSRKLPAPGRPKKEIDQFRHETRLTHYGNPLHSASAFNPSLKSGTSSALPAGFDHLTKPLVSTAKAPPICHRLPLSSSRDLTIGGGFCQPIIHPSNLGEDGGKKRKKKRKKEGTYHIPSSFASRRADHMVHGFTAYHVELVPKPHAAKRSRPGSTRTCTSHSPPTWTILDGDGALSAGFPWMTLVVVAFQPEVGFGRGVKAAKGTRALPWVVG